MGGFGSYYKGEKKKQKRGALERKLEQMPRVQVAPRVEIIGKGRDKNK